MCGRRILRIGRQRTWDVVINLLRTRRVRMEAVDNVYSMMKTGTGKTYVDVAPEINVAGKA